MPEQPYPSTYLNTFDASKNYREFIFNKKKAFTSPEANEWQSLLNYKRKQLANLVVNEGDIVSGGEILVNTSTGDVTISAGKVYVAGEILEFNESTDLSIPDDDKVRIGLYHERTLVTAADDITLLSPTTGLDSSGKESSFRIKENIVWGWESDANGDSGHSTDENTFYPIFNIENRVVIFRNEPPTTGPILDAIAENNRDLSGNAVINGLEVSFFGINGSNYEYEIAAGKAHVNGYPRSRSASDTLSYTIDPDYKLVNNEPHNLTVSSGQALITLNKAPAANIVSISATYEKAVTLTRGPVSNTSDALPDASIVTIQSVSQGATTYTQGVDYQQSGANVDWSLGGVEPSGGSSYSVTYRYIREASQVSASLTDTTITIQDAGAETLVNGTTAQVDYNYKLPRIDLIQMNSAGSIIRVKGIAQANPQTPSVSPDAIALAYIRHTWYTDVDPLVVNIGIKVIRQGEMNVMRAQIFNLYQLVAKQALDNKSKLIVNAGQTNVSVDTFTDESQLDAGATQTAKIVDGVLTLKIDNEDLELDGINNEDLQTLDAASEDVKVQDKSTGAIKINPYGSYDPLPKYLNISPKVDNHILVIVEDSIYKADNSDPYGIQVISGPIVSDPVFPSDNDTPDPQSLSPSNRGQIYNDILDQIRTQTGKRRVFRKAKARAWRAAGKLAAGETVTSIKARGQDITLGNV